MDYYHFLMLIAAAAGLNLFSLALMYALDVINTSPAQKLFFIRSSLVLVVTVFFSCLIVKETNLPPIKFNFVSGIVPSYTSPAPYVAISSHVNLPKYIFMFYLLGVAIGFFRILFSYLNAKKILANSTTGHFQNTSVFLNESITSPLSFGFPRAKIYLPLCARQWSSKEMAMSLAHEKTHVRRHDGLWKLFSLIMRAILFFAPWSYVLHKKFELEMELYCDECTCVKTNATPAQYGNLLLNLCAAKSHPVFNHLSNSTLKRRLLAMKMKKIKHPVLTALCCFSMVIASAGAIATRTASSNNVDAAYVYTIYDVNTQIFKDGQLISSPRIITLERAHGKIVITNKDTSQELRIDLVAAPDANSGIIVGYDIHFKDGSLEMNSSDSYLIFTPGEVKTVPIYADSSHNYEMKMRVTVQGKK